jgi:UDP-3-O-[3-hydroxymyristoyl] N-acetylglucosamine deacetylase
VQNTLLKPITCKGVGVHNGKEVTLKILPAKEDTGVLFIRTDLKKDNQILAHYANVIDTKMCTIIANEHGARVSTIEHLMSALWGCGIDNAIIEVDADEVPIMDGSSAPFVALIEANGIAAQSRPRKIIEILKPIRIEHEGKTIEIQPSKDFEVNFTIDFDHQAIGQQEYNYSEKNSSYNHKISRARTFGFAFEVEYLKKLGLAQGASLDNAVGIDENGVMNKEGLRYYNEFARHKVLDCIGDLYLACMRIKGKVDAFKAGHALNNLLLRKLFANPDCYRILEMPSQKFATA